MRHLVITFVRGGLRKAHWIFSASALLLAAGCGGGGGGSPPPPASPPPPTTFTVGGTVTGLTGTGLVLQNNGGDNRAITASGSFSFATRHSPGTAYDVTVATRPSAPSQACVVGNGNGNLGSANVTNVNVVCGQAPGKFLYLITDPPTKLRGYSIDANSGTLSPITPTTTSLIQGSTSNTLVASPDVRFLFTGNAGTGEISSYLINTTTGSLTEVAGSPFPVGGGIPLALTVRQDGAYVYAPYHNNLLDQSFLAAFRIDTTAGATAGTLAPVPGSPYVVGLQPGRAVIDQRSGFIYVSSGGSPGIYGFAVDEPTGALISLTGSPHAASSQNDLALWVGASVSVLFASNPATNPTPNDSGISAYRIDAATGALTPVAGSPFGIGTAGGRIRLSADGRFLFVAGTNAIGGATISAFVINQATGALSAAPGDNVQVGNAGTTVNFEVDSSGRYVASVQPNATSAVIIPINSATGALMSAAFPNLGFAPMSAVLDPSGLFAYVYELFNVRVHSFQIEPVGLFVTELPVVNVGSATRQALIVGTQ